MFYKNGDEREVLITKCDDPFLWYKDYVGCIVDIHGEEEDFYWAREPSGYRNIIFKVHCDLISKKGKYAD